MTRHHHPRDAGLGLASQLASAARHARQLADEAAAAAARRTAASAARSAAAKRRRRDTTTLAQRIRDVLPASCPDAISRSELLKLLTADKVKFPINSLNPALAALVQKGDVGRLGSPQKYRYYRIATA